MTHDPSFGGVLQPLCGGMGAQLPRTDPVLKEFWATRNWSKAMVLVAEFHKWAYQEKFGHGWMTNPPELRIKLHEQETAEVVAALNDTDLPPVDYLANIAKELCDVLYVVYGTAYSLGIPIDEIFALVHQSNMSKRDDNGDPVKNGYGKVMKTHNYRNPLDNIKQIISDALAAQEAKG